MENDYTTIGKYPWLYDKYKKKKFWQMVCMFLLLKKKTTIISVGMTTLTAIVNFILIIFIVVLNIYCYTIVKVEARFCALINPVIFYKCLSQVWGCAIQLMWCLAIYHIVLCLYMVLYMVSRCYIFVISVHFTAYQRWVWLISM